LHYTYDFLVHKKTSEILGVIFPRKAVGWVSSTLAIPFELTNRLPLHHNKQEHCTNGEI
jgi:hypothetical protein